MNTKFAFNVHTRFNKEIVWKKLYRCAFDFNHPQNVEQKYFKERVESLFYFNGEDEGTLVEKEYAFYLVYRYIENYADLISEESYFYDPRYSVHTCLNHLRAFFIDNDRLPNMDEFYKIMEEH